ncbi:hypothetical protein GCM10025876_10040 [Demequina litorisediminis]|uniref:Glycoside hydrolase family 42 N-terminal domain-containing protein n=1 Tax=Demequina litorisediminis TaxID=1849022 RepID=A0ABQ6IBS1_9MICO|nr:hypothetical protein GCM10025876_10040 [Demequina litorisediminis]
MEARYGTVEALNEAWGTAFWSQRYTAFSQVRTPAAAPYSHNPGQLLDFKRFTSDMLLECYLMEKEIILSAGATQPITTNFMGPFKPANYPQWAEHMDVVTDDAYPDPDEPESFRDAAFQRDLIRSMKPGVPWLLMEQVTGALNWRPTNAPKAPGQMAALSMQCIGRGADGVLFFQWRQSRAGAEKFHAAMLPHAGTDTRIWREVTALGAEPAALPPLPAGTADARVALVMDWESLVGRRKPRSPLQRARLRGGPAALVSRVAPQARHGGHRAARARDGIGLLAGARACVVPPATRGCCGARRVRGRWRAPARGAVHGRGRRARRVPRRRLPHAPRRGARGVDRRLRRAGATRCGRSGRSAP